MGSGKWSGMLQKNLKLFDKLLPVQKEDYESIAAHEEDLKQPCRLFSACVNAGCNDVAVVVKLHQEIQVQLSLDAQVVNQECVVHFRRLPEERCDFRLAHLE